MKHVTAAAIPILIFSLGACGQEAQRSTAANQAAPINTAAPAKLGPSERLLAAAEPFEKLTEIAFSAPLPEIDKAIVDAPNAADSVRTLLEARATATDKLFLEIDRARKASDRAGLALASIEIYRGIVSSVPAGTKIPLAVSLLDYAGFRYQGAAQVIAAALDGHERRHGVCSNPMVGFETQAERRPFNRVVREDAYRYEESGCQERCGARCGIRSRGTKHGR